MNSQEIHIKAAMGKLFNMFYEGNLDRVARAVFRGNTIPSDNWSFINRVLMHLQNTEDARGFNQWKEAGRYVKKGSKAFYIIAPMFRKIEKTVETKTELGEVKTDKQVIEILAGFKGIPVFRFEDTEGAPIIREEYKLNIPYQFHGIIKELGLKIDAVRYSGMAYGSYNLLNKQIELATPDIDVFLHELSHAVDDKLNGLKPGQQKDQEVVAEFSGAVIGYLTGYKIPLGNIKDYIEYYSFKELLNSLSRVERIVNYVIEKTTVGVVKQPTLV